jgi:hypothetical protein
MIEMAMHKFLERADVLCVKSDYDLVDCGQLSSDRKSHKRGRANAAATANMKSAYNLQARVLHVHLEQRKRRRKVPRPRLYEYHFV